MTLGLSNKETIRACSVECWGQKTAYVQEGRKKIGTVKIDNSFNKSDSNKRKKYRGEAEREQGMKGEFGKSRLKDLKRKRRNIRFLIRDSGKDGCGRR